MSTNANAIVQGSTTFLHLRDALLAALKNDDESRPPHGEPYVDCTNTEAVVMEGEFNIDLALRRALIATGLLVELT